MSVGYILRKTSDEKGQKVGIVFENTRLTFGEINDRVNRLANAIDGLGIKKGDRAGVLMFNCSQYLEIYFAMAKLGIILVPLNYRLTGKELQYILDDSAPKIIFIGDEFQDTISSIRNLLPYVQHYVVSGEKKFDDILEYELLLDGYPELEPAVEIDINDSQLIIYTSGTTGKPKGALISHSNTFWTCVMQRLFYENLNEGDSTLVVAPLYHTGAQNNFTIPMMNLGGKIVIMKRVDPVEVVETIQREGITTALLLSTLLQMIFELPNLNHYDLTTLRYVVTGGAPISERTLNDFYRHMGYHVCHGYGLTEGTAITAVLSPQEGGRKKGSIGKALFPVEVKIVGDQDKECLPGEVGELIQRGPTVMKEYWGNPRETRETIKNGWLHTGDLARYDEENFIYIVGRKKDMIISGEENIYPAEIEQLLVSHPKIKEAAVIGVPDTKWGEAVKAIVVCKPGEKLTVEEVIAYSKQHMASYKKPRFVEFIDELPRNPSMKVLKNVLRHKYGE
jgi:fatty-acyl-CoA synthase